MRRLGPGQLANGVTGWDPTKKTAGVTLSNANQTATLSSGATVAHVGGQTGHATGKVYFEVKVTKNNGSQAKLGIGSANFSFTSGAQSLGTDTFGVAYFIWGGAAGIVNFNGVNQQSGGAALVTNDVLQVAFDRGAGKLWFGVNNSWQFSGNPSAGTNPAVSGAGITTDTWFGAAEGNSDDGVFVVNFGGSSFAFTPPTGFSAWG